MARRKREEEHENHERWMVSYADFITLLFAFFVVMYSISSVNEGKYRVLSNTLTDAFVTPSRSLDPIQIGEVPRSPVPIAGEYASSTPPDSVRSVFDKAEPVEPVEPQMVGSSLIEVEEKLNQVLSRFVDQELVNVTRTERGIEVEMKSKMLFKSGSARLSGNALNALRGVARVLKPISNAIQVEGHTDNVPIKTISFPSNWELSAARAASVVHLFAKLGVDSTRMAAIGYGEFQPLVANDSDTGRQANRRVSIIVMIGEQERMSGRVGKPGPDARQ